VTTPMQLLNNDELVACAWIASIAGFTPAMTGTQLPPDADPDDSPAVWLQTGFVTVAVVGGGLDDLLPVHRPVMEVKCWAAIPGSDQPPWMMARNLAALIERACWDRRRTSRPLTPILNGITYPPAVVRSAYMAQVFRRSYGDAGDYACYQADMVLDWVTAGDRIP
jgi:hypothetical protein